MATPVYDLFARPYGFDFNLENTLSIGLTGPTGGDLPKAAIKLDLGADIQGASMLLKRNYGAAGAEEQETTLWNPLQLHWHAPSEHTHNGDLYVAEMHIVHTPFNGFKDNQWYNTAAEYPAQLAVLGVWFEEDNC
jgi:hypothetical protein